MIGAHSFGTPRSWVLWLQVLPLSATVINHINTMDRWFLRGSTHYLPWKAVCLLKDEGGLSLHDLSTWNKALLAKTLWNIHTKNDSLWIQWIHAEYLGESTIWEFHSHIRLSHLLKNILTLRDCILQNCLRDHHSATELLEQWFGKKGRAKKKEKSWKAMCVCWSSSKVVNIWGQRLGFEFTMTWPLNFCI